MRYSEYLSKLYRPGLEKTHREQFICLDKNEPPFSAFECLDGVLNDLDMKNLRVYPDPYPLYEKLAKFVGVDVSNLLITQGSEQAIEFVFRVFLEKNDEVVYLKPSFAMFDVFAYQNMAKVNHIKFTDINNINIDNILNAITNNTRLFVLANPNNPTGTAYSLEELEAIAKHTQKTNTIFLLDEAYFHFYDINSISLLKFNNVIITRTFSKALGIAGARVGYAISNSNNINLLRKLKPIDEINYLSMKVAEKVLDNVEHILNKNLNQVSKWKNIFKNESFNHIEYIDTKGNFILLKSNKYDFHKNLLLKNKILPKMDFSEDFLKNCFRFSVSTDDIMRKVLKLFKEE